MALSPKWKMTEKILATRPRKGSLLQPWATPRVQRTAVWGSSPERARYESYSSFPDRLALRGRNIGMGAASNCGGELRSPRRPNAVRPYRLNVSPACRESGQMPARILNVSEDANLVRRKPEKVLRKARMLMKNQLLSGELRNFVK